MLSAAGADDVVLLDVFLHLCLGPGVHSALDLNAIRLVVILYYLIRAETFMALFAVHQRIRKASQMSGCHPGLGIHQNRTVHTHIIRIFLDEFLPPGLFHIIL